MIPKPNIVLSMTDENRKLYLNRLVLNSGEHLPDPYSVDQLGWFDSTDKWPPLQFADIYHYVIHTPSEFTHESLKAFRSLEAYNYFVSGHVQKCFYHKVEGSKYCYIRSLVLPGQRQNPRTDGDLYDAWICLHDLGTINNGSCTCMAGLVQIKLFCYNLQRQAL